MPPALAREETRHLNGSRRLNASGSDRGPARRYCSAGCRTAASRKRRVGGFWSCSQGEKALEAAPAIALGQRQMGDLDEVTRTVLWAWGVATRMASHAREAHPKVACRCELVGKALADVLEENFPSR